MSTRRVTRSTSSLSKVELADLEATPRPRKVVTAKRTVTTKASRSPLSRVRRAPRSASVVSQTGSLESEKSDDDREDKSEPNASNSPSVPIERSTVPDTRSVSRQPSVLGPSSTRHTSSSDSIRIYPSLLSPPSTAATPFTPPIVSKGEITALVFASNQLLSLYIDSKNQGLPVNPQREAVFWQLLQATRALFLPPSPSSFLLSVPSVDSSGQPVVSTSDPAELAAFRLSDYAVFLHAVASIKGTVSSEAQIDELQEAWRMFLQLFREANGAAGTNTAFRHDGLLTLLLDIGTQLYILRRSTLSLLQQGQLLDELFSSSLVSRRTSQQGLRTKALKTLDDERWLFMSRARVAELNITQPDLEARFSFAAFQREIINFVQSRQALLLNTSQAFTSDRPDLDGSQTMLRTARSDFQQRPRLSEPIHHVRPYSRNPSVPASVRTSYSVSIGSRYPNISTPDHRRVSAPLSQREPLHTPVGFLQRRGSHIYSPNDGIGDVSPVQSELKSRTKPRYSALPIPPALPSPLTADETSPAEKTQTLNLPESPSNKGWEGNDTLDAEELEDLLGKNEEEEGMNMNRTPIVHEEATLTEGLYEDRYNNNRQGEIKLASPISSVGDDELLIMEDGIRGRLSSTSIKIEEDELIDELDLEAIRRSREDSLGSFLRESQINQVIPSDPLSRAIASDHSYINADEVLEATFALTREDALFPQSHSHSQSQLDSQPQRPVQVSPTSSIPADFIASLKARTAQLKQDKSYRDHIRSSSSSVAHTAATGMARSGVDSTQLMMSRPPPYSSEKAATSLLDNLEEEAESTITPFKSRQLQALSIEEEDEDDLIKEGGDTLVIEKTPQPSIVPVSHGFGQTPFASSPTPVNITSAMLSRAFGGTIKLPYRPPTLTPEPFGSEAQPVPKLRKDTEERIAHSAASSFSDNAPKTSQPVLSSSLTLPVFSQSTSLRRPFNKRKTFDTDSEESDSSIDDSFLRARNEKKPISSKILPPSWPSRVTSFTAPPPSSSYTSSSVQPVSSMPSGRHQIIPSSSPAHLRPTSSSSKKRQLQTLPLIPSSSSSSSPPASTSSRCPSSSLPPRPTLSNNQKRISSSSSRLHIPAPTSSYVGNENRKNGWSPVETLFFIRVAQEVGLDTNNCWTAILECHGAQGRYSHVLSKRSNVNLKDKMRLILQNDYPYPAKVPNGMVRYLPSGDARKIAWLKGRRNQVETRKAGPDIEREVDMLCEQARKRRIELEGESEEEDEKDSEPEPDLESEDEDAEEEQAEDEEEVEEEEEVLDVLTIGKANESPLFFQGSDD